MKILDKVEIGLLDNLVDMEVGAINHMYKKSVKHGNAMFESSCYSFENYLYKIHGDFIPSMCSEWRYFLVKLLKNIDNDNLEHVYKILFFSSGKEKDNHGTRPTIKK